MAIDGKVSTFNKRLFRNLAAAALAAICMSPLTGAQAKESGTAWLGAWEFPVSPQPPGHLDPRPTTPRAPADPGATPLATLNIPTSVPVIPANQTPLLSGVTVRQLIRVSVAGKRLRLRVSNEAGNELLVLGAVHVAEAGADGAIIPGTDHAVTFNGGTILTIPESAPYLSDPVDMPVKALERLAVTFFLPNEIPKGGHTRWQYVSTVGDSSASTTLPGVQLMRISTYLSGVDVQPVLARSVVVTMGDSITEGEYSTVNAFRSWPDRLAERLYATKAGKKWSVVNAGFNGNRLARNITGPSALARFDRDVLSVPGVKAVILLEAVNDLGRPFVPGSPDKPATADELIDANKQIIERAHEHGVKVIGATVVPYEGSHFYDPREELVREALNQWILAGRAFDGVIDFDAATRDPNRPTSVRAGLGAGDHLHFNDDGYQTMANAIDLHLFDK